MSGAERRREPIARRTFDPVRRESRLVGSFERTFYRPIARREVSGMLTAAERFDLRGKAKGRRHGPLGAYGVRILRELLRIIDFRTGRLEPAIETLMARLRLSRDAVVRAIGKLREHGFVERARRFEPTGEPGVRGPRVRQATNAYRVELPPAAARLAPAEAPPPDDDVHARAARAAAWKEHAATDESTPLGASLARLGRRMNASPPSGLNPAEG